MTEPIAVDVPGKPAFSRTAALPPGVGPLVEALTGAAAAPTPTPAPAPKAEPPKPAPAKVEAPKPAEPAAAAVTTAATVAAAAVGAPPVAAPAAGLIAKLAARFTRKQLAAGAAVCSLVVGAGAVRMLTPAKDAAPAETAKSAKGTSNEKVALAQPPVPAPGPNTPLSTQTQPPTVEATSGNKTNSDNGLPPLPPPAVGPVAPPAPSPAAGGPKITGFTPAPDVPPIMPGVAPPSLSVEPLNTGLPPLPEPGIPPVGPGAGNIVPTAATAPLMPPAPGGAVPPVPQPMGGTPAAPPALPPLPNVPTVTPDKSPVMPPSVAPGAPAGTGAPKPPDMPPPNATAPKLPDVPPGTNPTPAPGGMPTVPAPVMPALPLGGGTGMAPVTGGTPPVPAVEPKLPALPDTKPAVAPPLPNPVPGGMNTPAPVFPPAGASGMPPAPSVPDPNLFPGVAPKPDAGTAKPPAMPEVKPPAIEPPASAFPPPATAGGTGTVGFTKPAGATESKPSAPERAPRTSYDVDVYDPKDGDTYESISQEWYNSKQYAAALKAYNQNQPLKDGRYVNIPPKHILQRQSGGGAPGGARVSPTAAEGANWSAPPAARPSGAGGRSVYVVPRNGMTLQQVARETMNSEQRWRDIYDRNPHISKVDEPLAAGTELKLPPDAKVP